MSELFQQYTEPLRDAGGTLYMVRAYGHRRGNGWEGWLEFHPVEDTIPVLKTDRETSQPDRDALAYWASGLERAYFQGALSRARSVVAA